MSAHRPNRAAGILLHPTSLPGPYGIGDLGPAAYAWVDDLARARQKWWQILPLGPTGYGDSPYQCFSAFAGNPYLVSPDFLARDGLIPQEDLHGASIPEGRVDYGRVIPFKLWLLRQAWANFQGGAAGWLRGEFERFCHERRAWLDDYALFMALKDAHGGASWYEWPEELIRRDPAALQQAREKFYDSIGLHQFMQFVFFRQWFSLRDHAHGKGLRLIGDAPIFVSGDSADVWADPQLFLLGPDRRPKVVAGVPPDYFSATGQLWGNPLYDWHALKETGYAWWVERVRATLEQVDLIRLDHFRGFCAAWHVPAGAKTAQHGEWVPGPAADLLEAIRRGLGGRLPIIAEDLGLITPDVHELRDRFDLPGMRILQFAFGGATEDRFLPHNYDHNTVVYTGTHDNDTTRGWYATITDKERRFLARYLGREPEDVSWALLRLAWGSVADYAVAPLQDVLSLGPEARMNTPGTSENNWQWRMRPGMFDERTIDRLADLTDLYCRCGPCHR